MSHTGSNGLAGVHSEGLEPRPGPTSTFHMVSIETVVYETSLFPQRVCSTSSHSGYTLQDVFRVFVFMGARQILTKPWNACHRHAR